jgi:hypothetical protein
MVVQAKSGQYAAMICIEMGVGAVRLRSWASVARSVGQILIVLLESGLGRQVV